MYPPYTYQVPLIFNYNNIKKILFYIMSYNIIHNGGGKVYNVILIINIIFFIISYIMSIIYFDENNKVLSYFGAIFSPIFFLMYIFMATNDPDPSFSLLPGVASYVLLLASLLIKFERHSSENEKTKTGRIVASVFAGVSLLTMFPVLFMKPTYDTVAMAPQTPSQPPQVGGGYVSSIYLSSSSDF
jgi:hypothetical protein